ncbi:hypothetical protein M8818_003717 [Zalaria obscura]|uniref:Uncharacterized protein n=1 Tax=Zalaria obscura TaxID=2024903 RepID=A0ACC3SEL3_9PEZI
MRSLAEAQSSWQTLEQYKTLPELRESVRNRHVSEGASVGCRSVEWKIFLLFDTLDRTIWQGRLADSRSAYDALRTHFLRNLEHPEEITAGSDPLSEDAESPWVTLRHDEALRAEIHQDVERCMPENDYFREPVTQKILLDILFIFCKLNPDVGYRQGMHELLAPMLWVVEQDAIISDPTKLAPVEGDLFCKLCDPRYIGHDTFTLFSIIMQNAKTFYEQAAHSAPSAIMQKPENVAAALENPMVSRVRRIFEEYLPHLDPELAAHLKSIDLIPQVFLMRWIRLLFGREFAFADVLSIWDVIFSEDPTLELVDLICLTMLLRLHWDLMDADYNTALTLLLRYPTPSGQHSPQSLAIHALRLRDDFTPRGANNIIHTYTGRSLASIPDIPPPSHSHSSTPTPIPRPLSQRLTQRLQSPTPSLPNLPALPTFPRAPSANTIAPILQDAAKGMYSRSEKWGLNKAFRDAVHEVRKGVQEIQQMQTPQAPVRRGVGARQGRLGSRSGFSRGTGFDADAAGAGVGPGMGKAEMETETEVVKRLEALEQRNKALAKMLEGAVAELWEHQKDVSASVSAKVGGSQAAGQKGLADGEAVEQDEGLRRLGVAIAKVQFAQVYLADAEIPLPVEEGAGDEVGEMGKLGEGEGEGEDASEQQQQQQQQQHQQQQPPDVLFDSADPSLSTPPSPSPSPSSTQHNPDATTRTSTQNPPAPSPATTTAPISLPPSSQKRESLQAPRPSLAQSSFSWMLGQDSRPVSFIQAQPPPSEKRRSKGFLFGEGDDAVLNGNEAGGRRGSKAKGKGKKEAKKEAKKAGQGLGLEDPESFDLSTFDE